MSTQTISQTRGSLFPFIGMLILFLIVILGFAMVERFGNFFSGVGFVFVYFFFGVIQAQAGIYCIMGGAIGRSWISSLLQTSALAILSTLMFLWSTVSANSDEWNIELIIVAVGVIPLFLFCGSLPFLILRSWFGLHLTRETTESEEGYRLGIEDLFLAMVVVAGLLAIGIPSVSFLVQDSGADFLPTVLIALVISVVASAVAVAPVSVCFFRSPTPRGRAALLVVFAILGLMAYFLCIFGFQLWSGGGFQIVIRNSLSLMIYQTTATIIFSTGLMVLYWSGFRWGKPSKAIVPDDSSSVLDHDPVVVAPPSYRSYRFKNRIAAACFVLVAIGVSGGISYLKRERLRLAETFKRLDSELRREGGYLEHYEYHAASLHVPPNSDTSKFDLTRFQGLSTISLSGTQLSESNLKALGKLNSLVEIDLSYTNLDDSSFKLWFGKKKFLDKIRIAGTKITASGLNELVSGKYFSELDIGYLNLDDEAIAKLRLQNVTSLILRGNPITDQSIPHLNSKARNYLDVSGTQIVGSELNQLDSVYSLILDDTSVDDAAISKLAASNRILTLLSVRNTKVTEEALKILGQFTSLESLELGDGEITAAGLQSATIPGLTYLALNSRSFDGSLFETWKPTLRVLDMSHSGISDSDVIHLANIGGLEELSLAYCDISDSSLDAIAAMNLLKVDLTGTKVTASMAAKFFAASTEVYISHTQCSSEELATPDVLSPLKIGKRFEPTGLSKRFMPPRTSH